jgi:N-acetylneuraminic acid mutarotase
MFLQLDSTATPPGYIRSGQDSASNSFACVHQDSLSQTTHIPLKSMAKLGGRNPTEITRLKTLLPFQYLTAAFSSAAILSPWSTAAPSPIPRFEAANAEVNNKLYVFGGFNSTLQANTRSDVYDPATNKWAQLANMPSPITHAGVAVDGNTIYLAGGYIGDEPKPGITAKVFKYNVTNNTWRQGVSLPAPRGAGGLVVLGRELHFFGGVNRTSTGSKVDNGSHWVFNLDGGTRWVSKAPLPNPRNHFGYTINNGKIYAIGGQYLSDPKQSNQSDVHVYSPLSNNWTKVASLPFKRSHTHTSTFVRNGRIIIVGGLANGLPMPRTLANVTEYNPTLNKWIELSPLPEPRQATAAKLINNQIVVTTGAASGNNPRTTTWLGGG